jgi:histidine triad (HIT) family protein
MDIAPLSKGHTLVVPKEHHNSLTTVPARVASRLIEVAPKLGVALMRAVGGDGFNLLLSNGACAGQVVPHVHLHVIPRRNDDGVLLPARTVKYDSAEEKAGILAKARARIGT